MPVPQKSERAPESAERYRTLLEINNAIITNLDQEALLRAISIALQRAIPFDRAAFTLYDPKKERFRFLAIEGTTASSHFRPGLEFGREESISSWVFDHQRPALCGELQKEQKYPNDRRLIAEGLNSYCVVPLIIGGTSIGTLNIASEKANQYSEGDAEFLCELGGQVALAVANMTAYEEIAVLNGEVERSAERYRTLLELNNAIITHLTRETLLQAVSEILCRIVPCDGAVITIYNPQSETFSYFAMHTSLVLDHLPVGREFQRTETIASWVFDHQRAVIRRDLEEEQQYSNDGFLLAVGIRSDCIVPLIVGGKSIGTLGVGSTTRDQYSEATAEFLQDAANQIALAVANMRSYEEIAALNTEVERTAERYRILLEINNAIVTHLTRETLLGSVSQILRRVVPFDGAAITLYNPEKDTLRFFAMEGVISSEHFPAGMEFDRENTVSAWVFDHQRAVVRRDLEKEPQYPNDRRLLAAGIYSDCIAPLIVRGKPIGTLNIGSRTRNRYSEADRELVQEIANQVALAVANMVSYEEIADLQARLEKENVYLQEEIRTEHNFEEITGNSPALLAVLRKVEQVAGTDSTVLITGETGTGKELIARAIHDRSDRRRRALVKINCSAISAGLVESELFGHVKGAFTGALERHIGRFELADGGTIFLDEIGELPLATQVKLLRVLQEREFEPVGSNKPVRVDVRMIAATNRDLQESIRTGDFRSDLFYRLNVFPVDVPPLRERCSDIPQLAMFFLSRFSKKLRKDIRAISQESMERLTHYSWPGNVRELQNVIERAVILSQSSLLELESDLIPSRTPASPAGIRQSSSEAGHPGDTLPASSTLEEVDRAHIVAVLNQTGGIVDGPRGAAKILGLHPNTLRHRMRKLGLKRTAYHAS
jgi:formate hydrogenlyase transcriptional activator